MKKILILGAFVALMMVACTSKETVKTDSTTDSTSTTVDTTVEDTITAVELDTITITKE